MRAILFVILFIFSTNLISQNDWQDFISVLSENGLKKKSIHKFISEKLYKDTTVYSHVNLIVETKRKVGKKYEQERFVVLKSEYNRKDEYYELNVIYLKKEVIYLELYSKWKDSTLLKISSSTYIALRGYNDFEIEIDTNHKYYNPPVQIIIGFGCGWSGANSGSVDEMEYLVDRNNKDELFKWCQSLSPEIRCMGAIGLKRLEINGGILTKNQLKMIKYISLDQTPVFICSGCTVSGMDSTVEEMYKEGIEL